MDSIHTSNILAGFTCKGGACEDTCCKAWQMQVDETSLQKIKNAAPQLLDSIEDGFGGKIMRKNPDTSYCVKFTPDGLCGIHKDYGEDFLGDACFFYPRIPRRINGELYMSAALSCPEIARLALEGNQDRDYYTPKTCVRVPQILKSYDSRYGISLHEAVIGRLKSCSDFQEAATFLIKLSMLLEQENNTDDIISLTDTLELEILNEKLDTYRLLNTVAVLIYSLKDSPAPMRLFEVLHLAESKLKIKIDISSARIISAGGGLAQIDSLWQDWRQKHRQQFQKSLINILTAQVSQSMFPITGDNAFYSTSAIIFKIALIQLLAACMDQTVENPEAMLIKIVQTVSRFLDHMENTELLTAIFKDNGWTTHQRLASLIAL